MCASSSAMVVLTSGQPAFFLKLNLNLQQSIDLISPSLVMERFTGKSKRRFVITIKKAFLGRQLITSLISLKYQTCFDFMLIKSLDVCLFIGLVILSEPPL